MKRKIVLLFICVLFAFAGCSKTGAAAIESTKDIDLDLTQLSSTMVYSEVYNMMTAPDDYVGKKIKMTGMAATYLDETTGSKYYACVIADATACCQQGLEFVLKDKSYSEEDYPTDGEEIEVVGSFETYQEGDLTYCHLVESDLNVI